MIIAKNISKTYVGEPILENTSFSVGTGKKVGVVGKNGCGKSTLFKLIVGEEELSTGGIEYEQEVIGYVPQEFSFPAQLVGEYLEKALENSWDFYKIETLAKSLKFKNFDPYQEISLLSEGQKMKVKLIEVLLTDPTVLFIDEPTNHLDLQGIQWFEDYIKYLPITVVMISHDRTFLNNTVDEIWEIENKRIITFIGDYDNYKIEKNKLIEGWNEEYKQFLNQKKKLEKLIENARKISDGKKRGKAVRAAKKRFEREITENEKTKYVSKKINQVNFDTDIRKSKLVLKIENMSKSFGDKRVFTDLDFEIRGQEKVWLFGPNGAGKTTLLKSIIGEFEPDAGRIVLGPNMSRGYFAQKQTHLDFEKNLLDHFIEETEIEFGSAFGILRKFLFDKDALSKRVSMLSPGERARFAFAIFAVKNYDFLILDEPTNHLDIETKEVVEKSLREYKGTLLLVSHDRYFVEQVGVDKVLNLENGTLTHFEI